MTLFRKIMIVITIVLVGITAFVFKSNYDDVKSVDQFELDVIESIEAYDLQIGTNTDLEFVRDFRSGNAGYAFAVDEAGIILMHPREEIIGLHLSDTLESYKPSFTLFVDENISNINIHLVDNEKYMTYYHKSNDGRILVFTAMLKGNY